MTAENKTYFSSHETDEEIVKENMPLVHSLIKRYKDRGVDYDDLFQIGCIGLLNAARRFNPSLGYQFSTYASSLIIGEIKRYLRDDGIIKISRQLKENAAKINLQTGEFISKHSREPTISELAEITGLTTEEITTSLDATKDISSIDCEIFEGKSAIETISSNIDENERTINSLTIKNCLNALPTRDRKIIFYRYFKDKTQKDTANLLGISQVQVSRIEKKLLQQIKKSFTA